MEEWMKERPYEIESPGVIRAFQLFRVELYVNRKRR